jgi:hypothetical protein
MTFLRLKNNLHSLPHAYYNVNVGSNTFGVSGK